MVQLTPDTGCKAGRGGEPLVRTCVKKIRPDQTHRVCPTPTARWAYSAHVGVAQEGDAVHRQTDATMLPCSRFHSQRTGDHMWRKAVVHEGRQLPHYWPRARRVQPQCLSHGKGVGRPPAGLHRRSCISVAAFTVKAASGMRGLRSAFSLRPLLPPSRIPPTGPSPP